jgi:hypothetical protein
MSRLDGFRKSEAFLFAEQDKPVLIYEEEADISNRERLLDKILYDYDFTLFFKDAYGRLRSLVFRFSFRFILFP